MRTKAMTKPIAYGVFNTARMVLRHALPDTLYDEQQPPLLEKGARVGLMQRLCRAEEAAGEWL